jgi:transposase
MMTKDDWNLKHEVTVVVEQKVLIDLPAKAVDGSVNAREEGGLKPRLKVVNRNQLLMRSVDVEKLIEEDHAARGIWAVVERLDMKPFEMGIRAVEGHAGQSALDPRVLTALWIYANSEGVSSARELSRMCEHEPGCQWITGMTSVNYHTLSDFRVEQAEALNECFIQVLGLLSAEGLIELKQVMQDGTKVKANAAAGTFRREQRLQQHLELARHQVQRLSDPNSEEWSQRVAKARQRAVREKKQRLELALKELDKLRKEKAAQDREDTRVSTSDPEARKMKQNDGGYAASYNVQLSTDAGHGIIIGVGVTQDRHDGDQLIPAIEQIQHNTGRIPEQVVADGAYTKNTNIDAMWDRGIDIIGPVGEDQTTKSCERRGVGREFYPDAFAYDAATDIYYCPAGKPLTLKESRQRNGRTEHNYQAREADCQACPFLTQCCPKTRSRWMSRIQNSEAVQVFREKMRTEEAQQIYKRRKQVAEFPNAWIKDKLGLRKFRLRGLVKVRTETTWACLTYNIQQWIRLRWKSQLEPIPA